jgi:hypothetical protein
MPLQYSAFASRLMFASRSAAKPASELIVGGRLRRLYCKWLARFLPGGGVTASAIASALDVQARRSGGLWTDEPGFPLPLRSQTRDISGR